MNDFNALFQESRKSDEHWVARALQDFTEDLFNLMEHRGISKAELARRLESSPAYITKVLRGDANFTVRSMVRLARALEGRVVLHLEPEEEPVRWFDVAGSARRGARHQIADPLEPPRHLSLVRAGKDDTQASGMNHDPVAA
ncbi:MAG TPA: helix-turn-helix transcriptional regulator [Gammaproteobacteria bacterium]|nr:helix-turn-helix transcriptional regulator [Gammaproteobacteria bacterium]